MDLGDRVLSTPPGPEPVRARLKVRLEDRLQHQLQRGLDHPVSDGRDGDFILPSCSHVLDWIWILAIGAGHGAVVMLS